MPEVLIATLGTESQVVTLSLLELERLGFEVGEVVVVYTEPKIDQIKQAITRLDTAFDSDKRLQQYHYRHEILQGKRGLITDLTTAVEAEQAFEAMYRLVRHYKLAGYRIHLNIAGGRKPLAIYGMVTAQILFDDYDKLWYLISNEALYHSKRMFPEPGDDYHLISVPIIQWTDRSPLETGLVRAETPRQALREQETLRRDIRYEIFLKTELTPSEREVARLLAQGLSNEAIAAKRGARMNTVTKQVSAIYQKWRTFFGLEKEGSIRDTIVAELASYFARRGEGV